MSKALCKVKKKSYEFLENPITGEMVLKIIDTEGMLPLTIKTPKTKKIYQIIETSKGALTMR